MWIQIDHLKELTREKIPHSKNRSIAHYMDQTIKKHGLFH